MDRIDAVIDASLSGQGNAYRLTLDPRFQGLPDTAHGGIVLAVFDRLAGIDGSLDISGTYRRRVPPGIPLSLTAAPRGTALGFTVSDERGALVEGLVRPTAPEGGEPGERGGVGLGGPGWVDGESSVGEPLPVSRSCFACGIDNPLGLRLRLGSSETRVWGECLAPEPFRGANQSVAPVALTTALDEAAFWLGVLATGESGMTTELRVRLHRPARFGERLWITGNRAQVRPLESDPRYLRTTTTAHDAAGRLVASGAITFVTVRGAAKRLAAAMLTLNPPDVVRRVFPAYANPLFPKLRDRPPPERARASVPAPDGSSPAGQPAKDGRSVPSSSSLAMSSVGSKMFR